STTHRPPTSTLFPYTTLFRSVHRTKARDRQTAACRSQFFLNDSAERVWLAARTDDPCQRRDVDQVCAVRVRELCPWHVHDRLRIAIEAAVTHIAGNAHDLSRRLLELGPKSLPDRQARCQRIAVGPGLLRQRRV